MSEQKITLQELRNMQSDLAEIKAERQISQKRSSHQIISIGRLGRELFPGYFVRESIKSAVMKVENDNAYFGATEAEVGAEIAIPSNEYTFLWAVDFSLRKDGEDPNVGLRNTWLSISGEDIKLYPHTTPVEQTDWRYVGRDFDWQMSENSGKANLQDGWRPSSDCRRHPYGYVLAEEMFLKAGTKFAVKARPLGSNNMWLPDGSQQRYTLTVHLRCYEMVKPLNPRGL